MPPTVSGPPRRSAGTRRRARRSRRSGRRCSPCSAAPCPGAEASYRAIEDAMRERHPELPLFRACTSYAVRSKCAAAAPSLPGVLMRLVREGYAAANLVVGFLSAGEEYHKVRSEAAAFGPQLELCVTRPPLSDRAGLRRFLGAVLAGLPERAPDECVLFMGHGHAGGRSDFQYMAAASELAGLDPALHLPASRGSPPSTRCCRNSGENGSSWFRSCSSRRPCAERYGGRRAGVVEKPPRSGRI